MTAFDGALRVRGLRIGRGGRVLVAGDIDVPAAACTVLVAPSGSGLTSLAAALAGAAPAGAVAGDMRLAGVPLTGPPSRRRRQGLCAVLADTGVIGGCSVAEALLLAARAPRTAAAALERFPLLAARARLPTARLSGGERQLLRIACAWAGSPRALVLDDPLTGLAPEAAADIGALALEEASRGAAVLWLANDRRSAPAPVSLTINGGLIAPAR